MIASKENFPTMTPEEYFAWEEQQLERHEYIEGKVYAMSGGTIDHGNIAGNFLALLKTDLRGSGCRTLNSDCRVSIVGSAKYVYPDISVTCEDRDRTTSQYITYPCLIIEVLSPSTAAYDRGEKFENYRQIQSLQDYLLVAQDKMHIEYYTRQSDNTWVFVEFKHADDSFTLASIQCVLLLQEVYAKVILDQSSPVNGHA